MTVDDHASRLHALSAIAARGLAVPLKKSKNEWSYYVITITVHTNQTHKLLTDANVYQFQDVLPFADVFV